MYLFLFTTAQYISTYFVSQLLNVSVFQQITGKYIKTTTYHGFKLKRIAQYCLKSTKLFQRIEGEGQIPEWSQAHPLPWPIIAGRPSS